MKWRKATIKENNANDQLKLRSEAGFPIKGSRTSPLYSSRLRVEVLNYLLDWKRKIDKYEWYKQCIARTMKGKKNTSISNRDRVRVREKAIANTRNLFRGSSNSLYIITFTARRIFTIHLRSSTKELQWFIQDPEYITPTFNSLHKR